MNEILDYIKKVQAPLDDKAQQFVQRVLGSRGTIASKEFIAPTQPLDLLNGLKPYFEFGFNTNSGVEKVVQNWMEKIETDFYRAGIQMDSSLSEALRGGTLLLSNMNWPDLQFGRDFTDHVIWDFVNERFGTIEVIRNLLEKIPFNSPRNSASYAECKNFVSTSINGYGNSLVIQLHYGNDIAFPILVAAVAYMLDLRFSITLRKALYPEHRP